MRDLNKQIYALCDEYFNGKVCRTHTTINTVTGALTLYKLED